jgi:hypothetical protein
MAPCVYPGYGCVALMKALGAACLYWLMVHHDLWSCSFYREFVYILHVERILHKSLELSNPLL